MRHTIIRWTRCAVGSAGLLIPLALAVAACSRKDAGEDTEAVTSATTESAGGSTARAPAAGVDAGAGAALDKAMVSSIPPSCTVVMVNRLTYQQCGSTWYQPRFVGSTTSYVVVGAPR